jgi:hypothetical protein
MKFCLHKGVNPMPYRYNPATWMLEVIGAGTGAQTNTIDFHQFYLNSHLHDVNMAKVDCDDLIYRL